MTSPAADGLREARRLVEAGWGKGAMARDRFGEVVAPNSPEAVCYCAAGAIEAGTQDAWLASSMRAIFRRAIDSDGIIYWNDALGRKQTDVLAAFDRAIALAEADAGQEGGHV